MKRRKFINNAGIVAAAIGAIPLVACNETAKSAATSAAKVMKDFTLPDLGYALDALAPSIDAQTMGIHHGKHHAGYVRKLNNALKGHSLAGSSLVDIVGAVKDVDGDIGVRNNGGGHYNHSLFWNVMKPGGSKMPNGALADAIASSFGSIEDLKEMFSTAAKTRFGSGWAWMSKGADGKLFVSSTPNQDNPMMKNIVDMSGTPVLGIDVWEHAYYLNYQNRRGDYVTSFLDIINWDQVGENFKNA